MALSREFCCRDSLKAEISLQLVMSHTQHQTALCASDVRPFACRLQRRKPRRPIQKRQSSPAVLPPRQKVLQPNEQSSFHGSQSCRMQDMVLPAACRSICWSFPWVHLDIDLFYFYFLNRWTCGTHATQGLDWYRARLKQDKDGDLADEFLLEPSTLNTRSPPDKPLKVQCLQKCAPLAFQGSSTAGPTAEHLPGVVAGPASQHTRRSAHGCRLMCARW